MNHERHQLIHSNCALSLVLAFTATTTTTTTGTGAVFCRGVILQRLTTLPLMDKVNTQESRMNKEITKSQEIALLLTTSYLLCNTANI